MSGAKFDVGVSVPRCADCARLRGGVGGCRGWVVAHRPYGAGVGWEVIQYFWGMVPKCVFENRGMVLKQHFKNRGMVLTALPSRR